MIIGISGKIGSGKDTIGAIINFMTVASENKEAMDKAFDDFVIYGESEVEVTNSWEIKKFAFKLKQIASLLTGVPVEQFEDQEFKKERMPEEWQHPVLGTLAHVPQEDYMTYRKLLQLIGTEAMREQIHPNIWVNALFADYKPIGGRMIPPKFPKDYTSGNFDFPNWIVTDVRFPNEATAIQDRGGILIRVNRDTGEAPIDHPSETALDNYNAFDYVIDNNGTIELLMEKVKDILIEEQIIKG